jgi:tetratricopeptide (TPR) repeat protein
MRIFYIIITSLLLLSGMARAADGPADTARQHIDTLECRIINFLIQKDLGSYGTAAGYADDALRRSQRIGYVHGIAIALACQAAIAGHGNDEFVRSEKLARESLEWFAKTDNKYGITLAYYTLGFSLFAQSHFDEAVSNFRMAREVARRTGSTFEEIYMLSVTAEAYRERGDYARAFDTLRQCIQLAENLRDKNLRDSNMVRVQYKLLAGMFVQIEDYGSADKYFQLAFGTGKPEQMDPWDVTVYAELKTREHQYDSALYLYGTLDSARLQPSLIRTFLVSKGEYYLFREDYATALPYFLKSIVYQEQMNDGNQLMRCREDLAKTYFGLHRDAEAFQYAREELTLAQQTDARQNIRDGCQLLYIYYDRAGRTDSAYFYFRRYILLKDSVLNDQLKGRFASFGFEQQIRLLNEDKQLEDYCLRSTMMTRNLLIAGIVALFLFVGVYIWLIRLKRRNEEHRLKETEDELEIQRLEGERARAALQQRAKELEIQALRSQMSPHFIFNCLNAINRFILGHETEAASDYLTKFSRLMRMIMNHSRHAYISLAEEIDILRLYLGMEQLRFKDAFDYRIVIADELDIDAIRIPPLLVQPFVENAVWHGLMNKEDRGTLTISFSATDDLLTCVVRDNGVGRRRAAQLKSKSVEKHKSMGMQITAERMALISGIDTLEPFFVIEDLYDHRGEATGTQVTLTVRIHHLAGSPAYS